MIAPPVVALKAVFREGPYEGHGFVYVDAAVYDGLHGPNALGLATVCRSAALPAGHVAIRSGLRMAPGDTAPACYRHDSDFEHVHGWLARPGKPPDVPSLPPERVKIFSFDRDLTARAFGPQGAQGAP